MKAKTILSATTASSILAAAMMVTSTPALAGGKEKCADIVKAGKNGCGANGHSCAGQSKVDNEKNEWIKVPTGTCENIVSICTGKMEAPEGAFKDEARKEKTCAKVADQTDASITGGRVVE